MWETSRTFRKALLQLQSACQRHTRVIVYSYNDIWEPVIALAQRLRWRIPQTEQNWLSEKDPIGLLTLSGYEWLKTYRTALFQKYVPFLSAFMDRVVAQGSSKLSVHTRCGAPSLRTLAHRLWS